MYSGDKDKYKELELKLIKAFLDRRYLIKILSDAIRNIKKVERIRFMTDIECEAARDEMNEEIMESTSSAVKRFQLAHDCLPKKQREAIYVIFQAWVQKHTVLFCRHNNLRMAVYKNRVKYFGATPTLEELKVLKPDELDLKLDSYVEAITEVYKFKSILKGIVADWNGMKKGLEDELEEIIKMTNTALVESFK